MENTLRKSMATLMFALFGSALASAQESVPYSADFDGTQKDWEVVDKSDVDGKTWTQWTYDGTPGMRFQDEYYAKPNDYYISPAINVEAGKTYAVTLRGCQEYADYYGKLTAEVGTDKEDMSTFKVIGEHKPCTENKARFTDTYKFTAETTGPVYVAFHASEYEGMDQYVYMDLFGMSIEESTADPTDPTDPVDPGQTDVVMELPYYVNFTFGDKEGVWTTVDKSETPGTTFSNFQAMLGDYSYQTVMGINEDYGGANDYFISPKFKFEAGKTYTLDLTHAEFQDRGTLRIELGTDKNDVTTFQNIKTMDPRDADSNGRAIEDFIDFTVPTDGEYYIAAHATNENSKLTEDVFVYLIDFMVKEKENVEPPTPPVDTPVNLPYSADFASSTAFGDEWNVLDVSDQTGSTWEENIFGYTEYTSTGEQVGDPHPAVTIRTDWDSNINDYLITPAFELEEGKIYNIKVHAAGISSNTANVSLEYGTNRIDPNSFLYVANVEVPVEFNSESKDKTYELEINKSGVYYLALHARTWETSATADVNVFSFSIEEKQEAEDVAVELPYTADFTKPTVPDADYDTPQWTDWTALDRSDYASSTWRWSDYAFTTFDSNWNSVQTFSAFNIASENSNFNDYLVSPAMNLEAGKTYIVKTQAFTRDYSDVKSLSLELGTQKKIAASYVPVGTIDMNVVLTDDEYQAAKDIVSTNEVTVDADGKYYFAIHGTADADKTNIYAYVFNFSVEEKGQETGISAVTSAAAAGNATVYTIDGRKVGNNLGSLAKGTYIVSYKTADGKTVSKKIVK